MLVEETRSTRPEPFFFPHPPKKETVSHLVGAWNIDRVEVLSGPRNIVMASAGVFRTFFPDP